ncbi:MAG: hypothetical protein ABL921_30350 [Pirellula sp.]
MELDPEIVKGQLPVYDAFRYVEPAKERMWSHDGPYSRSRRYDTILQRDVEFCEEHLQIVAQEKSKMDSRRFTFEEAMQSRKRFIMEAKIGQLSLPHVPGTFDFGWIPDPEIGERFYFTRPLISETLAEKNASAI